MGELAGVPYPVFLFVAVEFMALDHRLVPCGADGIGYFAKLQPIPDAVAKLPAVHKGNTIDNKVVVDVIGVQVSGNYHLIFCAPHLPCGFQANLVCFVRCDLACGKALIPVIGDILAPFSETALHGDHFVVGVMLGAIDPGHIHGLVGLVIVFYILNGGVQIFVQVFLGGGLVRIVCVIDNFL